MLKPDSSSSVKPYLKRSRNLPTLSMLLGDLSLDKCQDAGCHSWEEATKGTSQLAQDVLTWCADVNAHTNPMQPLLLLS